MTENINTLGINIAGTEDTINKLYSKLHIDLEHFKTFPFINKYEKHDFALYHHYWAHNKIIGLLNFDSEGNFLPEVYNAPKEILRMQYPIDDLISFEKQGTLIIDREQYTPELRNLSYFIYIVDEELYDEFKVKRNYLGDSLPTYMFNRDTNDGVRVFRDYYELAKHLARQRYITFCIGPRAIFYMRWYMYELHEHTIETDYAFGQTVEKSYARKILDSIKRHMAFNYVEQLEYKHKVTIDNYSKYRQLAEYYKLNIPTIEEYKSTTMIQRFSKQTMHSKVLARIKPSRLHKYTETLGIQGYHHMMIHEDHAICFIWDTRTVELIIPLKDIDQDDISYAVIDNRNDIKVKEDAPEDVKEYLELHKTSIPVQFRYGVSDSVFDGSEEHFWKCKSGEIKTETE